MPDWLTWPADLLLDIGGSIAGWFVSKDENSFMTIQMMVSALVLAALVASIVYGRSLAKFVRLVFRVSRKKLSRARPF